MSPTNHNLPLTLTREESPEPTRKLTRRERRARERLMKKPSTQKIDIRREKERQMAKLSENQKLFRKEVLLMIYNKTGLTDIDAGKIRIEDDTLSYNDEVIGDLKPLVEKYFPTAK